jgi:hypothetical protein
VGPWPPCERHERDESRQSLPARLSLRSQRSLLRGHRASGTGAIGHGVSCDHCTQCGRGGHGGTTVTVQSTRACLIMVTPAVTVTAVMEAPDGARMSQSNHWSWPLRLGLGRGRCDSVRRSGTFRILIASCLQGMILALTPAPNGRQRGSRPLDILVECRCYLRPLRD